MTSKYKSYRNIKPYKIKYINDNNNNNYIRLIFITYVIVIILSMSIFYHF